MKGIQMRETWNGSGINSVGIEREFTCLSCGWEGEAEGTTDDSQFMLYAECPNCKYEMTIDLEAERETADWDNDREDY
jgi:transcription elongation factor Elf1